MKGCCHLDKSCEFTNLGDLSPLSVFWHQSYLSRQAVPQSVKEHCSRRTDHPPDPLGPPSQLPEWTQVWVALSTSRIFSVLTLGKRCLCSHPTLYSTISPHPCCRGQGKINDQSAGDVTPSPHRPSSIHPLWLVLTKCVIQCLKQGLSWMGCDLNHTINTISLHLQSNGFIFYSKYIIILFHYLLSAIIKMHILLFCFVLSRQPEDRKTLQPVFLL